MKVIKLSVVVFSLMMFVSCTTVCILLEYITGINIGCPYDPPGNSHPQGISQEGKIFVNSLIIANINFAKACQSTLIAANKAKDAERLGYLISDMQNNRAKYTEAKKFKEALNKINNATKKMKSIDYSKDLNYSIARKEVGKALLFLGIATYFDTQAVKMGKEIAPKLTSALKKDPFNLRKWTNYLTFTQIVIANVPNQLLMIKDISKNLIQYANSNGCKVPSQNEINKEIEKQRPDVGSGV